MTTSRLLPRIVLVLAALLASGCVHKATTLDAPPETVVIEAPAAEATAADSAAADAVQAARAAAEGTSVASPDAGATGSEANGNAAVVDQASEATAAERDYAAIYGNDDIPQEYNPIADPNLPAPATQPASYDPLEKLNRRVHRFNNAVDRHVAKPLATAYVKVVPRPVRLGVGNFFNNLSQPVSAVNALLQGKPKQAGQTLGRFLLNSTLGIGGIFDPATSAKLPNKSEDFGQTLGVWGWKRSRFIELPLFGPRTIRDAVGMAGDSPLSPLRRIEEEPVRIFLQGLQLVDVRTQLIVVDRMREGATDDYALVRDAWMQRRHYQIFGDSDDGADDSLPDYLKNNDDDNPTVPINAIPVIPGAP
jgi:phospholipid-binding lipoprotein MlaA